MSASSTAFIVDAMLGSLARKLRIFGFDTAYFRTGSDEDLIAQAFTERRILVTSDRALSELALRRGLAALLVSGTRDSRRIADLAEEAINNGIVLSGGEPRCAVCNGALRRIGRVEAEAIVPRRVSKRHRIFQSCVDCGKLFWRGSHWTRLRVLGRPLVRKNAFNQSDGHRTHASDARPRPHNCVHRTQKP
jgi:uncharacterized protein with PIN domain